MDAEDLSEYGIDYDKGLNNCMKNKAFYAEILTMFIKDTCITRAETAFKSGNRQELFDCMHELKGTSGNIALTKLYKATVSLVELLRSGNAPDAQVTALYSEVKAAYKSTAEGIRLYLAEQ